MTVQVLRGMIDGAPVALWADESGFSGSSVLEAEVKWRLGQVVYPEPAPSPGRPVTATDPATVFVAAALAPGFEPTEPVELPPEAEESVY